MENEHFRIEIEGEETQDIYPDLIGLEVEIDANMAAMFRLKIIIAQQSDGMWKYLDDERFSVWKEVTIMAGFEDTMEELIKGHITHVRPSFDPDSAECTLEIWGMDKSVLMDREEKLKDWPGKKDSDIVSEILNTYGLTPDVDDTSIVHDEACSTIIQRETDMQFMKRLASRNGFEFYVEGTTGYFKPPLVDEAPQPVLAVHFGEETNVNRFSLEIDALKPASVSMFQIDRSTKEVIDASIETSGLTALGGRDATALLTGNVNAAKVCMGMNVITGSPEMTALCQGLFDEYSWFVTGQGEISGNQYGHVLKTRQTVTIKGIGETFSGVYYVTHVTHTFTSGGYSQLFRVKRNAITPSGNEDFSSASPGGLL
jgi:phage protein D